MKKFFSIFTVLFFLSGCQNVTDQSQAPEQVACTQEAKLCPDGSSVGRGGLNCEFSACPGQELFGKPEVESNEGWKTLKNEDSGLTFQYPESLSELYTTLLTDVEFLPSVQVKEGPFTCEKAAPSDGPLFINGSKTIDGNVYCSKIQSGVAAGSSYNTYIYSTSQEDKVVTLTFTLQQVNCFNFADSEQIACEKEQHEFSSEDLAVKILNTVSFENI